MSNGNIFVGCGGTGIESLIRLNGLLAQDLYWRQRVDTDVFYLVIDTEADKLKLFEEQVRLQLAGAQLPYVGKVLLSRNLVCLTPPVREHFVHAFQGRGEPAARERLYQHWWTDPEGNPFEAPLVRPLSVGAGQCPIASFFLAWLNMPEIAKQLDQLIREFVRRRAGLGGDPFAGYNLALVTGLAGGTGRGCWELVAFKLRQMLTQRGGNAMPAPVGFFLDASAYGDIIAQHPAWERTLRLNSLTGISELSLWVRNSAAQRSVAVEYDLPSMFAPGNKELDVLDVNLELDARAGAPIDNAYLIFGESDQTFLDSARQAYDMVGAALYAIMTKSSVTNTQINQPFCYGSMGAATFEIPAERLQRYFASKARIQTLDRLRSGDPARSAKAVSEFLTEHRFYWTLRADDQTGYSPDPKGDILQRVLHRLDAEFEGPRRSLEAALDEDSPTEVLERAGAVCGKNPEAVENAFRAVLADMGEPLPLVPALLARVFDESHSVGTARMVLEGLKSRWTACLDDLPADLSPREGESVQDTVNQVSGREYGLFGRHFSEAEKEQVLETAGNEFRFNNYSLIREKLSRLAKGWIGGLAPYILNCKAVSAAADRVVDKLDRELHSVSGPFKPEDPETYLFTSEDEPERGLHQFDSSRFQRRVLNPLLPRETGDLAQEWSPDLKRVLRQAVLEGRFSEDDAIPRQSFAEELEVRVREGIVLPRDFMMNHFHFGKVLEELARAWSRRLNRVRGNPDQLARLLDILKSFYGVEAREEGDVWSLPAPHEFMVCMAGSLAGTCRPYWRLRPGISPQQNLVMVFLPAATGSEAEAEARIKGYVRHECQVEVYAEDREHHNPFVILAYATDGLLNQPGLHPLDTLESLAYWHSDPAVRRWLSRCEDPQGSSVFSQEEGNRGVGFVDPVFVRDERFSGMRWRPWYRPEDVVDREASQALDAMLYGLFSPALPAAVAEKLTALGWTLPLIRQEEKERFVFARRALRFARDKAAEADTPWRKEDALCTSIWQVEAVLCGRGTTAGTKKEEGLAWRQAILAEAEVFWGSVAPRLGLQPGSDLYTEMMQEYSSRLQDLRDRAKGDDAKTWQRLIGRVQQKLAEAEKIGRAR